jgi:hypothetical protein
MSTRRHSKPLTGYVHDHYLANFDQEMTCLLQEFGAERDRLLREALQRSRQMRHRSRSKVAAVMFCYRRLYCAELTQFFYYLGAVEACRRRLHKCWTGSVFRVSSAHASQPISPESWLQGWLVFLIVGFFTGLLAGMIQVSSSSAEKVFIQLLRSEWQVAREWAFDLKFGYCR